VQYEVLTVVWWKIQIVRDMMLCQWMNDTVPLLDDLNPHILI